jgi:ankyrin repeat protein
MLSGPLNDSVEVETDEPNVVNQVLNGLSALFSPWNLNHQSDIFSAISNNSLPSIKKLLNTGTDINIRAKTGYTDMICSGSTPLHVASRSRVNIEVLTYLLEQGANMEARNERGHTPLHIAVKYGTIEHVNVLLRAGAKMNVHDSQGKTPLHFASHKGDIASLEALLHAGADPEARDRKGRTAMHSAVGKNNMLKPLKMCNEHIISALLKNGANLEARDTEGQTPLHVAVSDTDIPAVNILLNYGANIEARDLKDKTPMHLAARRSIAIKKIFVQHNANYNAKDIRGKTPVFYEIEDEYYANIEDIQFVNKESVKTQDNEGNTVLHIAARSDCKASLKRILECKPDIHAKNNNDETPTDIAYHYGRLNVETRLWQYEYSLQEDSAPFELESSANSFVLQQQYESDKESDSATTASSSRVRKSLKAS